MAKTTTAAPKPRKSKTAEPATLSLEEQAAEILRRAEQKGVETNFFFVNTFSAYITKLKILKELEREIEENGTMIKKEYVKGRPCLVANPAINEFSKTSNAANSDVSSMIRIIEAFAESGQTEDNPLAAIFSNL